MTILDQLEANGPVAPGKYLSHDKLDKHQCAKLFQCNICLNRFKNIKDINSGNHRLRRKKQFVNCNNYMVLVSKSGVRLINNKTKKQRAREAMEAVLRNAKTKKAKKRSEARKAFIVWSNDFVKDTNPAIENEAWTVAEDKAWQEAMNAQQTSLQAFFTVNSSTSDTSDKDNSDEDEYDSGDEGTKWLARAVAAQYKCTIEPHEVTNGDSP